MKQPSNHASSLRLTVLIGSLLGLILTSIFFNRRSLKELQGASASIYKDRLIPAALIAKITSRVYRKRLLLESYVLGNTQASARPVGANLDLINRQVDSLLTEFEQTKLTPDEAHQLTLLRQQLVDYNQLEGKLTTNLGELPKAQQVLFVGNGNTAFGQVATILSDLSDLQLTVGQELLKQSTGQTKYIYALTALQIGLVLVAGLCLFWHRL